MSSRYRLQQKITEENFVFENENSNYKVKGDSPELTPQVIFTPRELQKWVFELWGWFLIQKKAGSWDNLTKKFFTPLKSFLPPFFASEFWRSDFWNDKILRFSILKKGGKKLLRGQKTFIIKKYGVSSFAWIKNQIDCSKIDR